MRALRTAVIIGSTREGRCGTGVAGWFTAIAAGREGVEARLLDLAEFEFPARQPARPTAEIRRFTDELARAEAFVVVTPEYNRSFPAALKQAVDYGYDEWHAKPVGFVSYGCGSDGIYAVEQLRTVFTELHTVTLRDRVAIDLLKTQGVAPAGDEFRAPGRSVQAEGLAQAAELLLTELVWWGLALRDARAARPYVS